MRVASSISNTSSGTEETPIRLLLVEDNLLILHMVRAMLGEAGLDVSTIEHADTLAGALDRLSRGDIDCALLDLTLPDAEGVQGVEKVCEQHPGLPIVVLTGTDDESVALDAVASGAQDYLFKGRVDGQALTRAIRHALERKRWEGEVARQAMSDPVTGLPNRHLFEDRLQHALARARRASSRLAVLFVDLDAFKVINDRHGHDVGDGVLVEVTRRLRGVLRPGDTLARHGGDEFTVLCEELEADTDGLRIARRLKDSLVLPVRVGRLEIAVSASIGVAIADDPGVRPDALIRDADLAMYEAKERGGGALAVFDEAGRTAEMERRRISRGLDEQWQRDLVLLYQPIVRLEDRAIVGVEALLRWRREDGELALPADFLSVAEESGLIVPIGRWALAEACREAASWAGAASATLPVHVNLSARELLEPTVADDVARAMSASGLPPAGLRLEVTEASLLLRPDANAQLLRELSALGVGLVLDDFGVGAASVNLLNGLPFDTVKIDGSLTAGLGRSEDGAAVVKGLVGLATALGVPAVAEGVQDEGQIAALLACNCTYGQGFALHVPLSADELRGALAAHSKET